MCEFPDRQIPDNSCPESRPPRGHAERRVPYCMNQPWLTTADWPLCTVVLAAA
jgi:hypothetical protein